jgi:hypothetical protein
VTWLLDRLLKHQKQPDPLFAFQATVNWMRALSILVDDEAFSHDSLRGRYNQVQRRQTNQGAETRAFASLLMALHNVSAIQKARELGEPYSFVRSAIVAWYYAIYYASKSMIAAATGGDPQTHAKTGKIWQTEIVAKNLAVTPFDFNFVDLTAANIQREIAALRGKNRHDLNITPTTREQAFGAAISYLKGTGDYAKWHVEKKLKAEPEFKGLGVADFRTKAARALRDKRLSKAQVNFLVQAYRYRGKANYRDAIYLSYGADNSETLTVFIRDLANVARTFTLMAAHYLSRRVSQGNWQEFVNDVDANARFPLPYDLSEI